MAALLPEGALKPVTETGGARLREEAPAASLPKAGLNQRQSRAKRGVSGEAPQALPVEGALSPRQAERSEV
jgi:hypothetical protein